MYVKIKSIYTYIAGTNRHRDTRRMVDNDGTFCATYGRRHGWINLVVGAAQSERFIDINCTIRRNSERTGTNLQGVTCARCTNGGGYIIVPYPRIYVPNQEVRYYDRTRRGGAIGIRHGSRISGGGETGNDIRA